MTVWPSIAAFRLGRFLGKMYTLKHGYSILTAGNILALSSIPLAIFAYFWRVFPFVGRRYQLTDRGVTVLRGLQSVERASIFWNDFEVIEIREHPGQKWFDAADLVFLRDGQEKFLLAGVSRPAVFREICLKTKRAFESTALVVSQLKNNGTTQ